jgi:hypothetical protein
VPELPTRQLLGPIPTMFFRSHLAQFYTKHPQSYKRSFFTFFRLKDRPQAGTLMTNLNA